MIALDGRFYRADVEGLVHAVSPSERTPFAVVVPFSPTVDLATDDLAGQLAAAGSVCAVRFDGDFESVRARSIPRQQPPYRPLAEVAADQHVFELRDVSGTLVGFRFPDYASGLEVAGYHLHFITDDRRRGGHVLDHRARAGRLRIDTSSELHVELPPGVELGGAHVDEEELARIERAG
jgi:acetolactate decarboxylase